MSQLTTLREIDAMLDIAFAGAGMADSAVYSGPKIGSPAVPCTVLIDRASQYNGFDSRVASSVITISVRTEVVVPIEKGRFVVGAETFVVDKVETLDEGRALCICKVGT